MLSPLDVGTNKNAFGSSLPKRALIACLVARRAHKIKSLADIQAPPEAEASKKDPASDAKCGVAPVGAYFQQGHEDESTPVHFGVGQDQPPPLPSAWPVSEPPAAIVQNIDVETPRSPTQAQAPASPPLDSFHEA
jgi:hypothetical protein